MARTGRADHHFSWAEEKECLSALFSVYLQKREAKKVPPEPELDRMLEVVNAGMIDEFLLFELTTRVIPQATLMVGPVQLEQLKPYVRRFVLVPVAPQASSADAGAK
jgi:hypothetical protein